MPATSTIRKPDFPTASGPRDIFATEHLLKDLRGRSLRGGAVTLGSQGVRFVLQLGTTATLARLLSPADFGLVAMVAAFTGFLALFKDGGLTAVTIQRPQISHEEVSALFWLNLLLSAILFIATACSATTLSHLYSEPRLKPIAVAYGFSLFIGGVSVQHYALLARQMRFRHMAIVQVGSLAIASICSIAAALAGLRYWALVVMAIAMPTATAGLSWMLAKWIPGVPSFHPRIRALVLTGGQVTGASAFEYMSRTFDNVVIGSLMGAVPLGIYTKAYGLLLLPLQQLNVPMNGVVLPVLSRVSADPPRYNRYYLRSISVLALIGMPLVCFCESAAEPLVLVILGPQWKSASPIFRALTPAALTAVLAIVPSWAFISLRRTDLQLRWSALSCTVTIIGILCGVRWGTLGVAFSVSITSLVSFILVMMHILRLISMSWSRLLRAVGVPLAFSVPASAAVLGIQYCNIESRVLLLFVQATVFALVYSSLWITVPEVRRMAMSILRSRMFSHTRVRHDLPRIYWHDAY